MRRAGAEHLTGPALRIGVAGCGRMGLPMARALARAGFDVTGYDVRPAAEFGDFAPRMAPDPGAFAADRDAVLTVVRDVEQTEDLLFRRQALLSRPGSVRLLVVCSTLSPRYVTALTERLPDGVRLVDAPMSGARVAAEEARLSFMLGGAESDLDALEPVFRAMGTRLHRMGPAGAGMTAKVLNNFVAASSTAATRWALDRAAELGVERERLLAVMHDSSGQTWFGSNFDRIEFARDGYHPGNTIGILRKDVETCLDAVPHDSREGLPRAIIEAIGKLRALDG